MPPDRPLSMRDTLCFSLAALVAFLSLSPRLAAQESAPKTIEKATANVGAASTVAYTNSMAVLDDRRKLGIGDQVRFRVVEDRKEPTPLVVTDSGEMEVPLIGRVNAAGKTCKQLAYEIKSGLEKEYYY